jgi:molybdate transport system substrate-binding protein
LSKRVWIAAVLVLSGAAVLALGVGGATAVPSVELNVYAAASLTDAMQQIAIAYKKATGVKISLNLGASSALARQIEERAPADVFLSADEAKMNELEQRGFVLKGTRRSLLSNTLVIVVPTDSRLKIASAQDLAGGQVKAISLCEPQTVPAGIYAQEYLRKIHVWDRVVKKLVPTENVRAALAAVESGNVEAGIVFKTDASVSKMVKVAVEIPAAEGPAISYPVAVLSGSAKVGAARRLVAYLESPAGLEIFRKYGFLIRPGNQAR